MRRRDLLAGLASVGVLGGAGAVATGTLPTGAAPSAFDGAADGERAPTSGGESEGGDEGSEPEPVEPVTLRTVDAPGSRDGEVTIPAPDRPTFVDFFATWCDPCVKQMPDLAAAHDRLGDDVLFVSVTPEDVGGSVDPETVSDWWTEHDGDWLIAADTSAELAARLNVGGYPSARAIDADGRIRWATSGTHTTEEFVDGIETVLDR